MELILLKFAVGLIILLLSTWKLVEQAKNLSYALRISPLIVGLTVVGIGTSLPELSVSLVSASKNDLGLAMGNIVGSNIVNILLIFPVGLLIGKLRVGTTKTQRNAVILLFVSALFLAFQLLKVPSQIASTVLLGLAVIVGFAEYALGVNGRNHEDAQVFKKANKYKFGTRSAIGLLFFALGIIGGSSLLVDSVETLSHMTGISTSVLGLTLTAIATSLPELLTTIFSQEEHQEKVTLGNILGSNIYNLLLIGGLISLFPHQSVIQPKEWFWFGSVTLLFVIVLRQYKGKTPPKLIAPIFLAFLITYLIFQ